MGLNTSPAATFGSIGGAPTDNAALAAALALKLDKAGGTMTGALVNSTNGAASTPPLLLSGTVFTGGSSTTTKPSLLVEPAGTTSTGWSTNGTMLGANAPSGFTGRIFDAQLNGVSKANINQDGTLTINKFGVNIDVYDDDATTLRARLSLGRWLCRDYSDSNQTANLGRDGSGGMALAKDTPLIFSSTANWFGAEACRILSGTGAPESVVTAGVGSLFLRQDGGANTTLYVKESGTGNTGWVAK
jgi:hypothetical protein